MKFLLIAVCLMVGGCMSLPFGITNHLQLSEVESKIETKEKKAELTKKRRIPFFSITLMDMVDV